jgi:selenocysteine lyase/cysteine desulfurase
VREAARRGIFTVLDGAQTIGQIRVDVQDIGCDAYVGSFHKWMGAPPGTGFMYVKADRIRPDRVYGRIKFLGERLRTALRANPNVHLFSPTDEAMCAGITVFNLAGMTGAQLQEAFWTQAQMRPRSQGDAFGVRLFTHIFNSPEEFDRAVAIVEGVALR